jgi:exopolyphosphatase/guanosine-5'-triphosphate,3'-diphosphate pyrophosphatase
MSAFDPESFCETAVVDIGSNSVRLVIYRQEGRALWTVFNEKVLAGLGRGLDQTGRLSREGVRDALTALRRFKAVLDAARPSSVHVVATAAVRDAQDGPQFTAQILQETGLRAAWTTARRAPASNALGAPSEKGPSGRVTASAGRSPSMRASSRLDPPRSPATPVATGSPASTPSAEK